MKISVDLEQPFSYMLIWVILAVLFVAAIIFMQIFFRKKFGDALKRKKKPRVKKPKPKTLEEIRTKYLGRLDIMESGLRAGRMTVRSAYQEMSAIIRGFVFEVTGIPVEKYTLTEIREVNIPALTQLVSEYYEPEFAKYTYARVNESLDRTKKVITYWR